MKTSEFIKRIEATKGLIHREHQEYQFTDSEIEHLKSTQTPAIAQAIDIAKELVSDEA